MAAVVGARRRARGATFVLGISSMLAAVGLSAAPAWAQQPHAWGRRSAAATRYRERQAARRLAAPAGAPGQLFQLLEGIDSDYRPIPADVKNGLGDPMATLLFQNGIFPTTLAQVLKAIDADTASQATVPTQRSFLIGEGGQVPFSATTKDLDRTFRFVIARLKGNDTNVLISVPAPAPDNGFLQVIAWDLKQGLFNYYERVTGSIWAWRGNSRHALTGPTRGKGCFDCHVNGSLVMKELKVPWQNWDSMVASIAGSLAPDSPLLTDPLAVNKSGGEDLEGIVVRPGISRWNDARAATIFDSKGAIADVIPLLRHLFETTSVNLTTSRTESRANLDKVIPLSFLLNKDVLFDIINLNAPDDFDGATITKDAYAKTLDTFQFALASQSFRQPGDTFFAFLVPEPAFEDTDMIDRLLRKNVVTRKFAASVLMVDFQNPVFSPHRAGLMKYVPKSWPADNNSKTTLSEVVADAITEGAKGLPADSGEHQFLANWNLDDAKWQSVFEDRIKSYLKAVTDRLATPDGVNDYVRLAESRRREFSVRPLHEAFDLMLPVTNIPRGAPLLQMNADGTVTHKP